MKYTCAMAIPSPSTLPFKNYTPFHQTPDLKRLTEAVTFEKEHIGLPQSGSILNLLYHAQREEERKTRGK